MMEANVDEPAKRELRWASMTMLIGHRHGAVDQQAASTR